MTNPQGAQADRSTAGVASSHAATRVAPVPVTPPGSWMVDGQRPPSHADVGRRALLVVHGMGQQARFDTLSGLASQLMERARQVERTTGLQMGQPFVQAAYFGTERTEFITLPYTAGGRSCELDVYEAYWAPLTEGVVKLADVMSFLWTAGFAGLQNFKHFARQIFNQEKHYQMPLWTSIHLLVALLVLGSLVVLNAVIAAGQISRILPTTSGAVTPALALQSRLLMLLLSLLLVLGVMLYLAHRTRGSLVGTVAGWASTVLFVVSIIGIIVGAGASLVIAAVGTECVVTPTNPCAPRWYLEFLRGAIPPRLFLGVVALVLLGAAAAWVVRLVTGRPSLIETSEKPARQGVVYHFVQVSTWVGFGVIVFALAYLLVDAWRGRSGAAATGNGWLTVGVWGVLVLLSAQVRAVIVQYVGDVAVYIAPYKLDRFLDVRNRIRDLAFKALQRVYTARVKKADGTHQSVYDDVIVVGHSLGSVVAYDALNRVLAEDAAHGRTERTVARTSLFLTFGSPLDKTAFLFTKLAAEDSVRQALASSVQAMLLDPGLRPRRWVNIWSPPDIVSGPLEFYDDGTDRKDGDVEVKVSNRKDARASTTLMAHVEYWGNPAIYDVLLEALATAP